MSTTQSTGTCIAIMTPRQEQFLPTTRKNANAGNCLSSPLLDKTTSVMLNQFGEQFRLTGIEILPDEISELRIFDEYLARHVQPNGFFSVQCMLLWSEWVRTFRRQTHEFPKLIREKEFRNVITDKFGIEINRDDSRGEIYPCIRFVP
ncbi:MAG: hypothetical protein Q7T80_06490 [Methanoregula sp.]|nr:hypothetical protein [Methanoregula sp.]